MMTSTTHCRTTSGRFNRLLTLTGCTLLLALPLTAQTINVSIDTREDRGAISPLIYGINAYVYDAEWGNGPWKVGLENHESGLNVPFRRLGGNTMTSYNWETGFSNSGNDDSHANNTYQTYITGAGDAPYSPGEAITTFHDHSLASGAVSLLQLPAAGYVAADGNGAVAQNQSAPSSRWKEVVFDTPGALPATPDIGDDKVHVDEEMSYLIGRYGNAASANGIRAYEIDNEPGLWHHYAEGGNEGTHSRLHPALTTCIDVIDRNIALAKTVRRIDPTAETYGPAMWGYAEMYSLWSIYDGTSHQPGDWENYNLEPYLTNNTGDPYRYNRMTWVNAYLDHMRLASENNGVRLLDVFSFHYYPAPGAADNAATRMLAPRSLWDSTYVESSWITQAGNGFTDGRALEILPTVQRSIDDFYPGTRIGITEYSFGGRHEISGGIAQADALGIFGREGVYAANYFFTVDDYIASAFRIYRNYDGMNSTFGDTSVRCTTSDLQISSAYASLDTLGRLHVILINKSSDVTTATLTTSADRAWERLDAWRFDGTGTEITALGRMTVPGSTFTYQLAPLAVYHLVLTPATSGVERGSDLSFNISASPNPTAGSGQIVLTVPESGNVRVVLHDPLGSDVATLLDGHCERGTLVVPFDAGSLAAGSYTVTMSAGGGSISTRLVIAR